MTILGVNVEALIILLSGFIVSFAFMIGTASAKYFEVCWNSSLMYESCSSD